MIDESRTYELDRKHVFHSWSAQAQIKPMVVTKALGSTVWDDQGAEYLDFSSQLVFTNIGHQQRRCMMSPGGRSRPGGRTRECP